MSSYCVFRASLLQVAQAERAVRCATEAAKGVLCLGGEDGAVHCQGSRTTLQVLRGHQDWVTACAYHQGCLYTACADGSIRVWREADWSCVKVLTGHTDAVWALAVHSQSGTLFSGGLPLCPRRGSLGPQR